MANAKAMISTPKEGCCEEQREISELLTRKGQNSANGRTVRPELAGFGKMHREEEKKRKQEPTSNGLFLRVRTFVACLSLLQLVQVMGSGYVALHMFFFLYLDVWTKLPCT